jgi:predicted ATPase/class 3 adenylate cyclase
LLPTGTVTFLFTDIEGSTRLWEQHPAAMREALARHDALLRGAIEAHGGHVFKTVGDAFYAAFGTASGAVAAALEAQRALQGEEPGSREAGEPGSKGAREQGDRGAGEQGGASEPVPSPLPALRVRMALHTGAGEERNGDYFGPPVNRVARLLSVANGGQILLSLATAALARDELPEGARLRASGELRLRDIEQAERVFQLLHPELPADFPALQSLETLPNNLPRQLTSFIGREREMSEVRRLLSGGDPGCSLLTLTGPGGCGKTRLALQVAADLLEQYPDGIWLVELALLSDPSLVPQAIASELEVREEAGRALTETLVDTLRPKTLLLLLDNCEHLLPECAQVAAALLRHCPRLRILATSREGLGVGGETTYLVPSLALPDPKRLPPVERLTQYEAVRLFIDRAVAAAPSFNVTNRNAPAVAQTCHRLDGIPLAIELAAARVKALPVEQIAERLDDRFQLLTGGSRTALPRQQTLRALIDWSYDLLVAEEQELFRRVSVFVGGFTLEAAEAVCADESSGFRGHGSAERVSALPPSTLNPQLSTGEVLDLLSGLVDRSLLMAQDEDGRVRYQMLETLRQYAREKLATSGALETMQARHMAWYLQFAEEAERKLRGSEQAWWLERLETEHENLRAALGWRLGAVDGSALRLAAALWWFWHVRGHFAEGREWLAAALAGADVTLAVRDWRSDAAGPSPGARGGKSILGARAKALNGASVLARNQGDYQAARALSQESLAIKRELGDKQGIAASLNTLATLALSHGEYSAARPAYEESLAIERELGNRQGVTASLIGLANVAVEQGDYETARALHDESLVIKRELGDRRGIATSLAGLGTVAFCLGDAGAARAFHEESLAIRRQLGDRRGIAASLSQLGSVATAQGDHETAAALLEESLTLRRELGDKLGIAQSLFGQGGLAAAGGDRTLARERFQKSLAIQQELGHRRGIAGALEALAGIAAAEGEEALTLQATRMFSTAAALRDAIGAPLPPVEREDYDRGLASLRAGLGEEAYSTAWEEGRETGVARVVERALEGMETGEVGD